MRTQAEHPTRTDRDATARLIADVEKAVRDYRAAIDPKMPLGPWGPLLFALNVPGDRSLLRRLCDAWETGGTDARARIATALIGREQHQAALAAFFDLGEDR